MDEHINDRATKDFVKEVNNQRAKSIPIVLFGSDPDLAGKSLDDGFGWLFGSMVKQCAASWGAVILP